MIFYGTVAPPEQLHTLLAITNTSLSQISEKTQELNYKSGECRATTTKCLGLLLVLSAILIPGTI